MLVHAELDDHALVEAGDRHRPPQHVLLTQFALDDDLLDDGETERELDGGHSSRNLDLFAGGPEALQGGGRRVGAVRHAVDPEAAGGVGLGALADVLAIGVLQADRDAGQGAALAIEDGARDAPLLGRGREGEQGRCEQRRQDEFRSSPAVASLTVHACPPADS